MSGELHANVQRVVDAAAGLGLTIVTRRFPEGTKTAADAAAAIGVDVGQIVKSLIFGVDGEVVLAYVSGANQLDERKLASAAGGLKCSRVDADVVRQTTGFPIGGVPPFGHANALRIFIDPDLLQYGEVWAAAGTWNDVFGIEPQRLVAASGGTVVDLARRPTSETVGAASAP
jgi:prolyl-tRNA editing enzyme YbaK/EbsC (Cys-tRNA(Pro) deacylase)